MPKTDSAVSVETTDATTGETAIETAAVDIDVDIEDDADAPTATENTALKAFDKAIDALEDAPLLHKGECAQNALAALRLVLADLYARLDHAAA